MFFRSLIMLLCAVALLGVPVVGRAIAAPRSAAATRRWG
jgi:hypothetical protein